MGGVSHHRPPTNPPSAHLVARLGMIAGEGQRKGKTMYIAQGAAVGRMHCNEFEAEAHCADHETAIKAAGMFDKARDLNDRQRKYTASARVFAQIETLPGFRWVNAP